MDILSVKLYARQLQGTHRGADDVWFFVQLVCVAAPNALALGLPWLRGRLRLPAAVGLCLANAAVLLLCAAANTRRFFARGCGVPASALRPLGKVLGFRALVALLQTGLAAASLLPAAVVLVLTRVLLQTGLTRRELTLLLCGTAALAALALVTFARAASLLFLAPYAYAGGSGVRASIRQSIVTMAAQRRAARRFRRSFCGWFLLCALAVPAPFVWSYYQQSAAVFAGALLPAWQTGTPDDQPTILLDKWAKT
ncbi:MAG: hypothetical protein IJL52_07465 [Clostridia bacterium]|nr:hypothetical protein [Clostridia bacterium]